MKPLKEIGREVQKETEHLQALWLFSAEERRELVREAILSFLRHMNGNRNVTIPSIEEFVKSEGL
jgi:hypothetical protein